MGILFATGDAIAIPSLELLHQRAMIDAILAPAHNTRTKNNNTDIVSEFAIHYSIPLLQPLTLDENFIQQLDSYSTDLLVCFAYGKYFSNSFLTNFSQGAINVHPSLLPRFRGASPIVAAILAGDLETGITIQTISSRLDAGDILYQARIPIDASTTSKHLRERIAQQIAKPLFDICQQLLNHMDITYVKQNDSDAVYCRKISKSDGTILWSMAAQHIIRLVKSMDYWPIAHTYFNGKKLNIIQIYPHHLPNNILNECDTTNEGTTTSSITAKTIPFGKVLGTHSKYGIMVHTGKDIVGIEKLQLATKNIQHWKDFINGHSTIIGSILG